MAAMTTALKEYSAVGDSVTYGLTGHVPGNPRLLTQKRRVPSGKQTVASTEFALIFGAVDAEAVVLAERVALNVSARLPINRADDTELDAAIAILRDVVNGDEFVASIKNQFFLEQNIA
jgi:hypothetical protein